MKLSPIALQSLEIAIGVDTGWPATKESHEGICYHAETEKLYAS